MPGAVVVGEPVAAQHRARDQAAAAFFGPGDPFAVLPSDHAIDDEDAFEADFRRAMELAARDAVLVTFGIKPTAPETNFGWLREAQGRSSPTASHRVAQFTEKPDRDRATAWWRAGVRRTAACSSGRAARSWPRSKLAGPRSPSPLAGLSFELARARVRAGAARHLPSLESISVDYAGLEGRRTPS